MAGERKFVTENIRRVLLKEFFMKETKRAGFGGLDIQRTPMGTRVTLMTERPGLVIGRRGVTIKMLTDAVENRFKFDKPQIEVIEVDNPNLNAQIMAEKLASALERGWHFRRAGHSTVRRIMGSGARGCQIIISGKLTGQRHRMEKFKEGHIKFCGEPKLQWMEEGFAIAKLKLGVIGVKVQIMDPNARLPDEVRYLTVEEKVEDTIEEATIPSEPDGSEPDKKKPESKEDNKKEKKSSKPQNDKKETKIEKKPKTEVKEGKKEEAKVDGTSTGDKSPVEETSAGKTSPAEETSAGGKFTAEKISAGKTSHAEETSARDKKLAEASSVGEEKPIEAHSAREEKLAEAPAPEPKAENDSAGKDKPVEEKNAEKPPKEPAVDASTGDDKPVEDASARDDKPVEDASARDDKPVEDASARDDKPAEDASEGKKSHAEDAPTDNISQEVKEGADGTDEDE